MTFDWCDYLVIADELALDSREGMRRTSISRAYYSIYHLGLIHAQLKAFSGVLPNLHRKLWVWYERHPDKSMKRLGLIGSRLRTLRTMADYEDSHATPQMVIECLNRAHAFEKQVP